MSDRMLRIVLVLSLALNVGALSAAAYHRYWRGHGPADVSAPPPGAAVSLQEELRLSDDQVRQFNVLRDGLQARVQVLRGHMHERRQAFFALLAAPTPDPEAVDRVLVEMNRTQFDMQRAAADYLLAQMRLLSRDQRVAFAQSLSRRATGTAPRHLPLVGPEGAPRPDEPR